MGEPLNNAWDAIPRRFSGERLRMTAMAGFLPFVGLLVGLMPGLMDHGHSAASDLPTWSLLDCQFAATPPHQRPEDRPVVGPNHPLFDEEEEEDEDTSAWKIGLLALPEGLCRVQGPGVRVPLAPTTPSLRAFLSRSSPLRC